MYNWYSKEKFKGISKKSSPQFEKKISLRSVLVFEIFIVDTMFEIEQKSS